MKYRVIGICGNKYHGKSSIARYISEHLGNEQVATMAFANPVKSIVHGLLTELDIEVPVSKHEVIPQLGKSLRHLYVTLGTKWGRDMVAQDLWAQVTYKQILRKIAVYTKTDKPITVVIEDVRFQNEVDVVQSLGGTLIHVVRYTGDTLYVNPDDPISEQDESEKLNLVYPPDYRLLHNTEMDMLKQQTLTLIDSIKYQTYENLSQGKHLS